MVYPVVSRRSIPISEEVVYGKCRRITAAGLKVHCWYRSEQRWDSKCAVQGGRSVYQLLPQGSIPGKGEILCYSTTVTQFYEDFGTIP